MTLSVLSVASEAFPLVKTGGLADVVGALPDALSPHGIATTTLLPGYPALAKAVKGATVVHRWPDLLGVEARLLASHIGEHPLLVLDAPELFARPGGLYGQTDDWQRFAAFALRPPKSPRAWCRAIASTCSTRTTGRRRWHPPISASSTPIAARRA